MCGQKFYCDANTLCNASEWFVKLCENHKRDHNTCLEFTEFDSEVQAVLTYIYHKTIPQKNINHFLCLANKWFVDLTLFWTDKITELDEITDFTLWSQAISQLNYSMTSKNCGGLSEILKIYS